MSKRLPEDIAVQRLLKRCEELNYTFLGFTSNYRGITKTKMKLNCMKHDYIWTSTLISTFINGSSSGCRECQKEVMSKANSKQWIGETRQNEKSLFTIVTEDGKYVYYKCSKCSMDVELYPDKFKIHKSDWKNGGVVCGCSKSPRRNKTQYEILCRRKAEKIQDIEFIGFTEEKVTVSTNIVLSCRYHGEWNTSNVDKFLSKHPRGCPSCAKENNNFGLYEKRLEDEDYLYLIRLTNKDNTNETFIKIGRTFNPKERMSKMPTRSYNIELLSVTYCKHSINYQVEQLLHYLIREHHYTPSIPFGGSVYECFNIKALENSDLRKVFGLKDGSDKLYGT